MAFYGNFQTQFGLGRETTPGTPPVAGPGVWLPVATVSPKNTQKFYEDKAFRGNRSETFGHYPLGGYATIAVNGPFYPDSCGLLLYGATGQDTVKALPTPVSTNLVTVAGATSLVFSAAPTGFANGMAFVIDTGSNQEINMILSGATTTTWTLVSPLRFAHAAGVSTAGNTMHSFQLANVPPTMTVYDYYGPNWRQYTYGTVSQFDLKWDAQADVTHSSTLEGQLSTVLGSPPTAAYTTQKPFVGWSSGVIIGGTSNANLMKMDLTIKSAVTPIFTANNQQSPTGFFVGALMVSGKSTFVMKSDAEYNYFAQNMSETLQFCLFGYSPGATSATGCMFQMSNPTFTMATINRGKAEVQVELDFAADYNAGDAGSLLVNLTNAITAY